MARSTKDAWLSGPGDLKEADVEDVPVKGQSVRVRALPAAYSNQAQSEATETKATPKGDAVVVVNKARLEVLQFAHGVIDPEFSVEEAQQVSEKYGPAFSRVIDKIDELSALDKEAIEQAQARFQGGGTGSNGSNVVDGSPSGSSRPDVPARTGAGAR